VSDAQRTDFEAWHRREYGCVPQWDGEKYNDMHSRCLYDAYLAAAKHYSAAADALRAERDRLDAGLTACNRMLFAADAALPDGFKVDGTHSLAERVRIPSSPVASRWSTERAPSSIASGTAPLSVNWSPCKRNASPASRQASR